ncbi:hypothetical protein BH20CHL6_BH20CHL6_19220 [soil metagenome]|jgi:hypothetical protein
MDHLGPLPLRTGTRRARLTTASALLAGLGLLALVTLVGWDQALQTLLIGPPSFVRFLLGTSAALIGVVLVLRAAERLSGAPAPTQLVRGVRTVFLAVAAFAAAAGWFIGSPVPIVVGLVIAAVDVIETSFLLLVTAARPGSAD